MERLEDLNRLLDIEKAKPEPDAAEVAKLQGKIDKTPVSDPVAVEVEPDDAPEKPSRARAKR